MVKISRRVEYALVAVQYMLHTPHTLVSARDLSARFDLPAGLLAKILQRLAAAGILESEQGAHGGYRLGRDPDTVSFLELSEAVEGPLRVTACEAGEDGACARTDTCTVAEPMHTMSDQIVRLLAGTTLGALLHTADPVTQRSGGDHA